MEEFIGYSVVKLKDFYQKEVYQCMGYKREQLLELARCVYQINLQKDPDHQQDDVQKEIKKRWEVLGVTKDPFDLEFSSECDSDNFPIFGLYDIFNYLINSRSEYDRKHVASYKSFEDYRLFSNGYVTDLKFNNYSESLYMYKAAVKPTQRDKTYLKKNAYDLWIIVDKSTVEIKAAYCQCIGGADGACRHVAAALYAIEAFDVKSVTDGPVSWKRKATEQEGPLPIKKLAIYAPKYNTEVVKKQNDRSEFDPRHSTDKTPKTDNDIMNIGLEIQKIAPNSGVLGLLLDPDQLITEPDEPMPEHLTVMNRCKEMIKNLPNDHTLIVSTPAVVNDIKYTPQEIEELYSASQGQSDNPFWSQTRVGMVTASSFKRVCTRTETLQRDASADPSKLLKDLCELNHIDTPALRWGRKSEDKARAMYSRVQKKIHKRFRVNTVGLRVSAINPFVGGSPDGVTKCDCSEKHIKLIEIKSPYALKNVSPKDAALARGCASVNGVWKLNSSSEYYYQIQGLLGLLNLRECDLIFYTKLGIHVVPVPFDSDFFRAMMDKIDYFCHNYLKAHVFCKAAESVM